MKKAIGIIAGVALAALVVLTLAGNKKKIADQTSAISDQSEVVTTYTVTKSAISRTFTSNAAVQAGTELTYVSDVTGRVVEIYADKGSAVHAGTPLLKIDDELIRADYKAALAAFNALKKDEARFSRSNKAGGISDQQLDQIRTQLQAAESRLAMSRWKMNNVIVKSPMDGIVNMRFVEKGSLIAPNAPLFEIVDNSTLKATCMVPERRLSMISAGSAITATDNSRPGKTFHGRVRSIGIKTDRGMNYPVEITLEPDPDLHVGMYLAVTFSADTPDGTILIPRKAVVGSALSANVYLAKDGRAVRREVKLGEMYGGSIEVVDGLEEGDVIVLSGLMNVADGTEIRIRN